MSTKLLPSLFFAEFNLFLAVVLALKTTLGVKLGFVFSFGENLGVFVADVNLTLVVIFLTMGGTS